MFDTVLPVTLLSSFVKPFTEKPEPSAASNCSQGGMSGSEDCDEPGHIDSLPILRKRTAAIAGIRLTPCTSLLLASGLEIGTHIELVPPEVYKIFFLWYSGSPPVSFICCLYEFDR